MMKNIFLFLFLFSCQDQSKTAVDEIHSLEIQQKAHEMTDSIVKQATAKAMFADTLAAANSPVKVISARPVTQEYSNYKDISLTYKNVSAKNISAIRFKWYGLNAFGEPADMGAVDGFGAGFTDSKLRAGKTTSSEWSMLSRDLKKVTKAWAYEVVFEDGTKWEAKQQ